MAKNSHYQRLSREYRILLRDMCIRIWSETHAYPRHYAISSLNQITNQFTRSVGKTKSKPNRIAKKENNRFLDYWLVLSRWIATKIISAFLERTCNSIQNQVETMQNDCLMMIFETPTKQTKLSSKGIVHIFKIIMNERKKLAKWIVEKLQPSEKCKLAEKWLSMSSKIDSWIARLKRTHMTRYLISCHWHIPKLRLVFCWNGLHNSRLTLTKYWHFAVIDWIQIKMCNRCDCSTISRWKKLL